MLFVNIMKTAIIIIAGFIVLTIVFIAFANNRNKSELHSKEAAEPSGPTMTGRMVVDTLSDIGYFKYTDKQNLDTLKKEIADIYDRGKVLTTINYEKRPYAPFCKRLYYCDGETLFEIGGVVDYLKDIKPTFEEFGIPLVWSNDYFSDDATEHTIIINDKKYVAFKGDPNDPRAWGVATKNFVEIINDQLSIHNSDERIYPILFNNDGRIVFLTKPQYDFIFKHFDKKESPMEVSLWWDTFK